MRLAAIALALALAACTEQTGSDRHGRLYFAAGNYIGEFDLADGKSDAVINLGDVVIDDVAAYGDDDLLLTMRVYSNGREVSQINRLRLRTGEILTLFPGLMAKQMPAANAVIFDDGSQLMATHRQRGYRDETRIDFHGFNARPMLIVMSDSEVLYTRTVDGETLIHGYDVVADQSVAYPELSRVCTLSHAVWLSQEDALLCRQLGENGRFGDYVLATLAGDIVATPSLPPDIELRALVDVPDQGLVVFTERAEGWAGGQPRYAVWLHDLASGDTQRINKDQYLGTTAVYRP